MTTLTSASNVLRSAFTKLGNLFLRIDWLLIGMSLALGIMSFIAMAALNTVSDERTKHKNEVQALQQKLEFKEADIKTIRQNAANQRSFDKAEIKLLRERWCLPL